MFIAWIDSHSAQIRAVLYGGLGLAVVANIVTSVGQDDLSVRAVISPVLLVVGLAVVSELGFWLARSSTRVQLFGMQSDFIDSPDFKPLKEMISESKSILILGQTLRSFSMNKGNLDALQHHIHKMKDPTKGHEFNLQILMLDPGGQGIASAQSARTSRKGEDSETGTDAESDNLAGQARDSFRDLCRDNREIAQHIRFYKEHPTFSLYKFDSNCLITVYTMGRGASSPALFFVDFDTRKAFTTNIVRGFQELWSANSTVIPSDYDWVKSLLGEVTSR